jgi:hypothetical protein
MTHHDFDLSEVLSELQSDERGDLVRQMVSFLYQALIDAEATEMVQGPSATNGPWRARPSETGHGPAYSPPRPATWS